MTRSKTRDLVYIALCTAIITVCAYISIPSTVPFTLQTFGIFFSVGLLGGKRGTAAVFIYILLGMVGAPVFAGFSGGLGYMLGPTGGYIVGFLFSAATMWLMEWLLGDKSWVLALSMFIGMFVCYAFGTVWFIIVYTRNTGNIGLLTALIKCVFPFILPDTLKILLALLVCKRVRPHMNRQLLNRN